MRRRQWVREGDLIIVWPWDFQDSKADVKHRYTKTQAMYLSRKGVLPDDVDVFGMNVTHDDDDEHSDIFGVVEDELDELEAVDGEDDDVDDMFASDNDDDDVDDMFASDDDETDVDEAPEVVEEEFVPVEEYPDSGDDDDDDDDDIDIDSLFG